MQRNMTAICLCKFQHARNYGQNLLCEATLFCHYLPLLLTDILWSSPKGPRAAALARPSGGSASE